MATRYNINNVFVSWGVVPITGLAKDNGVSITYNNDFSSVHVSADGKTNTRNILNDRSATIEVTLSQTSSSQALLQLQFALSEAGGAALPMLITNFDTGATFAAESCWIKKAPDASFGEEAGEWTWTFETDRLIAVYGEIATIEANTP